MQEILISHLDKHVVAGPMGAKGAPGRWRTVAYEADGFTGVLLGCGHGTRPEPVTLRLDAEGPHRIWLGVYGAFYRGHIRVRLTDDLCCRYFVTPNYEAIDPPVIHELFWKECDISGQELVLEGAYASQPLPGALAFIRLEPIGKVSDKTPAPDLWRPMVITNDGHGEFTNMPHHRPEDILESLERIPSDCCMRSLLWGIGSGDNCNFPTKVGNPMLPKDTPDPFETCDTDIGLPNLRLWRESGWDSLKVMCEYARRRRWEMHVYIRMQAWNGTYPHEEIHLSDFFSAHPECWCVDREGHTVNRMSYAHRQVQDHMLDLIEEILSYEPDGISLCLVRGVPMTLYEPIMVEGFKKRFGQDPRSLDEADPRWLDYQAGIFTRFIERVKERVGPHRRLSVIVPGNEKDLRYWALDVARWVRDSTIDDLYPVGQKINAAGTHYDAPDALEFDYFQTLEGRDRIRLIPCLYPWTLFHSDIEAFRRLIRSFLERGADQYCIWDGHIYDSRKMGDIGNKNWGGPAYAPDDPPPCRKVNMLTLNGFRIDRYGNCEIK